MWISKLARIVSVIILILSLFQVAMGLMIATEVIGPYDVALAQFLPGRASTGEAINSGTYGLLVALGLGTLAEIALKK